jgi:hypothetical protein
MHGQHLRLLHIAALKPLCRLDPFLHAQHCRLGWLSFTLSLILLALLRNSKKLKIALHTTYLYYMNECEE